MGNLGGVFAHGNTWEDCTETHKSSFFQCKQASGRKGDHEWLRMNSAFILCDLLWKVKNNIMQWTEKVALIWRRQSWILWPLGMLPVHACYLCMIRHEHAPHFVNKNEQKMKTFCLLHKSHKKYMTCDTTFYIYFCYFFKNEYALVGKQTDPIWLLQLTISSPLIHALGDPTQASPQWDLNPGFEPGSPDWEADDLPTELSLPPTTL